MFPYFLTGDSFFKDEIQKMKNSSVEYSLKKAFVAVGEAIGNSILRYEDAIKSKDVKPTVEKPAK